MRYLTIVLLFFTSFASAQNEHTKIEYQFWAPVEFYFNSLTKLTTGVSYLNYNQLKISCIDSTNAGVIVPSTWSLEVEAISSNLLGDETGTTLPLEVLEFKAEYLSGKSGGISMGKVPLTSGINLLYDNGVGIDPADLPTDPKNTILRISYYCGITVPVISAKSDRYTAEVRFVVRIK